MMKLYSLDIGDRFTLAGDDNSPVFIVYSGSKWMHIHCKEVITGEIHIMYGGTPVLYIK